MLIAFDSSDWNAPPRAYAIIATCYVVYPTLWWWAFARRYLHVPHALGVAAAGVVMGGLCFVLAFIACFVLTTPG